jgi:SAM-dependent methyltransferase
MTAWNAESLRQKVHYERMHDAYAQHYYDPHALRYREDFILAPLLGGIDLNGADMVDLASGSGYNTLLLRNFFPQMQSVGLDISDSACEDYRRLTGAEAFQVDLTQPLTLDRQFDAALVNGGLHHCVADLKQTIDNIARLLKPNGVLLMMEPSADGLLEPLRKLWYRNDKYFDAPTEAALSHDRLLDLSGGQFRSEVVRYMGGPAYFLVLNSMIFRVPLRAKGLVSAITWPLERAFNGLNSRAFASAFIARWRRV